MARLLSILLAATVAASCGYFTTEEPHLAPQTPLLPPTTDSLTAPVALTPTTTPPSTATTGPADDPEAPSEVAGLDAEGDPNEGDPSGTETDSNGNGESDSDKAQLLEISLIRELSHDPTAFTQGLEISEGRLFESTGAPQGRSSSIRELDRATGEVMRLESITEDIFAEGLTFVDGRIFQLTWLAGTALVRDPEDFSEIERFSYEGQGWGLCYNGRVLVMSDGSAELHFRDPETFERVGEPVAVTLDGKELPSLNELECVDDRVYANVWMTDLIVQIDPVTGQVVALADFSNFGLPRPDDPNAVLNGIAWDPETETFLVTGKDWPTIYEISFESTGTPVDETGPPDP